MFLNIWVISGSDSISTVCLVGWLVAWTMGHIALGCADAVTEDLGGLNLLVVFIDY